MRDKDDYLLLSQLTQAGYCLRRVALVMNEQLWQESADTAKGSAEHEKVHTQRIERRSNELKLFEYDVFSETLGIKGKCDCIEAVKDASGCTIPAADFPVRLYPVEFKHGKVRSEEEYEIQLCAQAMCLEEMYKTNIPEGAIFYTSSHRRYPVQLDSVLRDKVRETVNTLWDIRSRLIVPPAEYGAKCVKCSMQDLCMPKLQRSAKAYCEELKRAAKEAEAL